MFVIGDYFGETEFALNCLKIGVILLNKSCWIIWVDLNR